MNSSDMVLGQKFDREFWTHAALDKKHNCLSRRGVGYKLLYLAK